MGKIIRRYGVLILVLFITALLANVLNYEIFYKSVQGIKVIESIPLNLASWRGYDLALDEVVYSILETKSIIHRVYNKNGYEVLLSIVYYPETKVDFHGPASCLGGRGIETHTVQRTVRIFEKGNPIDIDLNQIIWQQSFNEQLIYYFYKTGGYTGSSYIKLRFALAANTFMNADKSGSLIRISTPVLQGNYDKASNIIISFMEEIYPFIESL